MSWRGIEDNKHFLLHCHQFYLMRIDLFRQLTVTGIDIYELDSNALCNLLLFGSQDLNVVENRIIIEATISFIEATERFLIESLEIKQQRPPSSTFVSLIKVAWYQIFI